MNLTVLNNRKKREKNYNLSIKSNEWRVRNAGRKKKLDRDKK